LLNRGVQDLNYGDDGHNLDLDSIEHVYSLTQGLLNWNFENVYLDGDFKREGDSQVYVMPHKSYWDPLIFAFAYYSQLDGEEDDSLSLLDDSQPKIYRQDNNGLVFAAGDNVTRDGWWQDWLSSLGAFSIDREISSLKGLRELRDYMAQQLEDYDLLIFPEKHEDGGEKRTGRSCSGKVGDFSSLYLGAVKQAVNGLKESKEGADVDLVPVDITYEQLPEGPELGFRADGDASVWSQLTNSLGDKRRKLSTFLSKNKLPAHLSLGEPINYHQQIKRGRNKKELGQEVEEKALGRVKPTTLNVVASAYKASENVENLSEAIDQVYQVLTDNGADMTLLESKQAEEIREEGEKMLNGLLSSAKTQEQAIDFYSNQIEHLLQPND